VRQIQWIKRAEQFIEPFTSVFLVASLQEVLWFLMFLLLFVWFTPLAPDYNGPVRAAFISSLKQSFAPFISGVQV